MSILAILCLWNPRATQSIPPAGLLTALSAKSQSHWTVDEAITSAWFKSSFWPPIYVDHHSYFCSKAILRHDSVCKSLQPAMLVSCHTVCNDTAKEKVQWYDWKCKSTWELLDWGFELLTSRGAVIPTTQVGNAQCALLSITFWHILKNVLN